MTSRRALLGSNGGEGRRAADEGAWQERHDDLVLDLVAFLLVDLAHLLGLDFLDFFLDRVTHDTARQDALFLAGADQQEVAADVHQRCVLALAERRDETVGRQFLACTGTCRLAGQRRLQGLGFERNVLGQSVHQQVFEPHGVNHSLYIRRALNSVRALAPTLR
jgi:hypothetical protein